MKSTERKLAIGSLIGTLIAVVVLQALLFGPQAETLSYSEFKALARNGKISDLVLDRQTNTGTVAVEGLQGLLSKERIEQLKRAGSATHRFTVTRVDDPGLVPELEAANIKFAGRVDSTWLSTLLSWIVPTLLFVGVWFLLMRRLSPQQGLMAIGKSKAKVYVQHETGVTFDDVAGIDEACGELMEIVDFLKNPDRYRRLGGKIPKGVLIVGAPGTGKTLLAKAVAGQAGVPFFSLSGSDFVEMGPLASGISSPRRRRRRRASSSSTSWTPSGRRAASGRSSAATTSASRRSISSSRSLMRTGGGTRFVLPYLLAVWMPAPLLAVAGKVTRWRP